MTPFPPCPPLPRSHAPALPRSRAPETVAFDARYVSDRYHGIGRHAFNLLEALTRLDPERRYVAFYNPDYPNRRFDLAGLARARPSLRLRAVRLPLYLPTEQAAWPLLLRRERAAIFHSPYVPLPLLAPVKLLPTVHDLIFERFPAYMPQRHLRAFYRAMTWLGARRAAAVLTVSEATKQDIVTYYPHAAPKARVIGNAVEAGFRREADPDRLAAVRARYRLPERFALTVGAGRPHKNVETVVEAFARLDPAAAPALVVAGEYDARFRDGIAARVEARGLADRVHRPGFIAEADLAAVYSLAEVLVFPSLVEGFGLPALEAMACGTPVVSSNASSLPDVVGDAALLFNPRRPDELAERLARVFADADLRADLARRGLARARELSWDRVAQATLGVYRGVDG